MGRVEWLVLADWIFHFLHFFVILSNLTFWWFHKTLWVAQVTLSLTLVSWVVLGAIYGWGYCFLTDWQWRIKELLGQGQLPNSYIKFVLERLGWDLIPDVWVDLVVLLLMLLSVMGCLVQTVLARRRLF